MIIITIIIIKHLYSGPWRCVGAGDGAEGLAKSEEMSLEAPPVLGKITSKMI